MKSDVALKTYPFETRGNVNRVYVVGDEEVLGHWSPANAVSMIRTSKGKYQKGFSNDRVMEQFHFTSLRRPPMYPL